MMRINMFERYRDRRYWFNRAIVAVIFLTALPTAPSFAQPTAQQAMVEVFRGGIVEPPHLRGQSSGWISMGEWISTTPDALITITWTWHLDIPGRCKHVDVLSGGWDGPVVDRATPGQCKQNIPNDLHTLSPSDHFMKGVTFFTMAEGKASNSWLPPPEVQAYHRWLNTLRGRP